jgi:diguanylate cyclase (GGDEF)-like protein/PAS domain S-box-containing protein
MLAQPAAADIACPGPGGCADKSLTVASSNNFPPINFLDETGALTGFGRDLSDAVLRASGYRVNRLHSSSWNEVLGWINDGQADLIHDTGYTKEREEYLSYSASILQMPEVIFVREGNIDIYDFQSLKGKTVACVNNHITHLYLKTFPEIRCLLVNRPLDGLTALLSGDADAFVYPREVVLYFAQRQQLSSLLKIVGEPLRVLHWGMTVKKGNKPVLDVINRGLEQVRSSGEYERIYHKWFGQRVLSGYSEREVQIIATGSAIAALFLAIIASLFFHNRSLKAARQIIHRSEEELRSSKEVLQTVIENAPARIFWKDRDLRYLGCNVAFAGDIGLATPQDVVGKSDFDLVSKELAELYRADDRQVINSGVAKLGFEEPLTMDGRQFVLRTSKVPLKDSAGRVFAILGMYEDITERKAEQARIASLAYLDALTGLPNRLLFSDRLQLAIARARRDNQRLAVLFVDLDKFKPVNDTYGHAVGDQLLQEVARRMRDCVRESDTVGRIGGDEFVVLLSEIKVAEDALAVAEKIYQALREVFIVGDYRLEISSCIGVGIFPENGHNEVQLMKSADDAMYRAKDRGRDQVVLAE